MYVRDFFDSLDSLGVGEGASTRFLAEDGGV